MPKRFGIIHCYDTSKWWPIGSEVWKKALQNTQDDEEWIIYDLPGKGELPKHEDNLDAVVITGSARGAYEDLPWIRTLSTWIQEQFQTYIKNEEKFNQYCLPIVGGCFGAQMIGHALGGVVKPQGFYILRAEEIQLAKEYFQLPWVSKQNVNTSPETLSSSSSSLASNSTGSQALPSSSTSANSNIVRLIESHGDCVAVLPSNGKVLGSSRSCQHELFLVGNCLGIQSHPEFDTENIVYPLIWPSAIGIGVECPRLSAEEAETSKYTFSLPRDELRILHSIKQFMLSK